MCIIAIKPADRPMFADEQIRVMFANNPHGAGLCYYHKDAHRVAIKKGFMDVESLLKYLHSRDFNGVNVILHFRISTSGYRDDLNCHPFPVYAKNKTACFTKMAVAHNGILRDYEPAKNSAINDTQVFIHRVLSRLSPNFVRSQDKLTLIEELIGTNKLAFLDEKNRVTTIGQFITDDGYLYSNDSYKAYKVKKTPKPVKVYTSCKDDFKDDINDYLEDDRGYTPWTGYVQSPADIDTDIWAYLDRDLLGY